MNKREDESKPIQRVSVGRICALGSEISTVSRLGAFSAGLLRLLEMRGGFAISHSSQDRRMTSQTPCRQDSRCSSRGM
jgi:hypothetical protein